MAQQPGDNITIDPGTVRAPRTPGLPTPQVANLQEAETAPLKDVANALSKGSEEVNEVAKLFAKQAGYKTVSRDAEGNLQVAQAPIVGDAAIAFHSAVKFSALALGESEAKQQDLVLSKKYPDDPNGYLEAAKAFKDKHVEQFTKAAGEDVGAELGRSIDTATTNNYRFLVLQQQKRIKDNFDTGTKAKIESLDEDITSLIKTGGDGTPEGRAQLQRLIDQRIATTKQRVQNPVLGESPDVAAQDLKKFDVKVGGARFISGVNKVLENPAGGIGSAQQMVDSVLKDESMPPIQRAYNYAEGQKTIKEYQQNLERALTISNKAQKIRDEGFESNVIKDSASGNPGITENDIKTAPGISPEARMRMLAWQRRDGMPEPMGRVSQETATDLFRRMNLPDDDPQHISDLREVRNAYVNGKLKRSDEEWLEKRFIEGRTPEGSELKRQRTELSKGAAQMLDGSTMMKIDSEGKLRVYNYERFVDGKIDEYRKAGKNPLDLFDPTKSDFLGKPDVIRGFTRPLQEQINEKMKNMGVTSSSSQPKPQRQPGENPDAYLKRIGQAP